MPLTVCVYEDERIAEFYPLTYLRPVFSMRAGIAPLSERVRSLFPDARLCLAAREALAARVTAEHKGCSCNIVQRDENGDVLFVNGRLRDAGDLVKLAKEAKLTTVFRNKGETAGVLFKAETIEKLPKAALPQDYAAALKEHAEEAAAFDTTASLYRYCWEIMADIEEAITREFAQIVPGLPESTNVTVHDAAVLVGRDQIHLGNGVQVMPGAIIDASHGPVYIGDYTRVEPQAAIYGPTYIGPNCVVVAGKVAASSIGHTSRVGGEVEESIFQSYVNKYHAGFIGHSYVGSWVNFGAMTTNSDLKNNYSNIRVSLNGEQIDTGSIKVGSFIGDHTKFGIGTLLNTGINIGVCCNIFGGSLVADKEVPSFSWGGTGEYQRYRFDKAIETARRTAGRREVDLSDDEENLLKAVFDGEISDKGTIRWPRID